MVHDIILQLYRGFDFLAALVAVIAAIVMSFDTIPEHQRTIFSDLAIGFLGSAIISSIIALVFNQIVLFEFQAHDRLDSNQLWIQTGLVDVSIAQLMSGLIAWSIDRYPLWVTVLVGSEALILLLGAMVLSSRMRAGMSGTQEHTLSEKLVI